MRGTQDLLSAQNGIFFGSQVHHLISADRAALQLIKINMKPERATNKEQVKAAIVSLRWKLNI